MTSKLVLAFVYTITERSKFSFFFQSKPENVSSLDLAGMIELVGKQGTLNLMDKVNRGEMATVNASSFLLKDIFGKYASYGTLRPRPNVQPSLHRTQLHQRMSLHYPLFWMSSVQTTFAI